jgi:NADP-dependent 3-hydroxy acid dehydrogenase YdfG
MRNVDCYVNVQVTVKWNDEVLSHVENLATGVALRAIASALRTESYNRDSRHSAMTPERVYRAENSFDREFTEAAERAREAVKSLEVSEAKKAAREGRALLRAQRELDALATDLEDL